MAQTLSSNGRVFLVDVFRGNERIADVVTQMSQGIELWAMKMETILLMLGGGGCRVEPAELPQ